MITLSSAENVLKDVYLGVIADQINTKTNPLFSKIKRSTRNIAGKEVRVVAPVGINGGIMAGAEDAELPEGVHTPYLSFVAPLKNLYGRFEISDKAIRCSSTDVNSFVNLLQDGMESLLKASIFNLSRMIYGDGSGLLAKVTSIEDGNVVDNAAALAPGMLVDVYRAKSLQKAGCAVTSVDRASKKVTIEGETLAADDELYLHSSKDSEIVGLKGIVNATTLYGNDTSAYPILKASTFTAQGTDAFDEDFVQARIDDLEMNGTAVNFINCSYELKRLYQYYLKVYNKNIEYTTLDDGMKVLTHFGTPIVPTEHVGAKEAYFLNTNDFTFYELGDWRWLEDEGGRILRQHQNKPAFFATLVKYTELVCQKPNGIMLCKEIPNTIPKA